MSGIYVLIVVWATGSSYGGVTALHQEFSSSELCNAARVAVERSHQNYTSEIRMSGCFKK